MSVDWEIQLEKELSAAQKAWKEGNDGKTRACIRRATGIIITIFNQENPQFFIEGTSAVDKLRNLSAHPQFPSEIRKTALRLSTNVRDRLTPDFTLHPLNDGNIIIDYFKSRLPKG